MSFWTGFEKAAMRQVATVGLINIQDRKILMGKRRDNGRWTCPGGHLEEGEGPIKGAMREVMEESGVYVDEDDLIHVKTKIVKKPDGEKLKIHAYKAFFGGDEIPTTTMKNDPDGEVERWRWVPMAGGLPKDIGENLHVPLGRNVLLDNLNFSKPGELLPTGESLKKTAGFWDGFQKEAVIHRARRALSAARRGLSEQQLVDLFAREAPQQYVQRSKGEKRAAEKASPGRYLTYADLDRYADEAKQRRRVAAEKFHADLKAKLGQDLIPGGLADKRQRSSFDPSSLRAGQKVELEHTNSKAIAEEIARDHLAEDPNYYKKLKKIEKPATNGAAGEIS